MGQPTDVIDNRDDVIDSRDVIERIQYLESIEESGEIDSDDQEELDTLRKLAEDGEGYSDWTHGVTLIRDSFFREYAQDLAEEIGAVKEDSEWPYTCIDWDQAAKELQYDYSSVEFDGVTYWLR